MFEKESNILLYGCFTTQLWLQGKNLQEVELLLGFGNGMLRKGAWFYVATELPHSGEFEFAGYSHVSSDRTLSVYGENLNSPKTKEEKEIYLKKQENIIRNEWSPIGSRRLIKVLHESSDPEYPIGKGCQPW